MACHPAAVVELTIYPFTSAMLELYSLSILVTMGKVVAVVW